ncbi:MAG: ROK family protein, partial [Thermomicrobiales bacterium]
MPATGALAIGIDVGGTKIAAGILDPESGARARETRIPTAPERGGMAILADCAELAATLWTAAEGRAGSIGIGLPELVDRSGCPASGETVDWRGLDVNLAFASLGPVALEAD